MLYTPSPHALPIGLISSMVATQMSQQIDNRVATFCLLYVFVLDYFNYEVFQEVMQNDYDALSVCTFGIHNF